MAKDSLLLEINEKEYFKCYKDLVKLCVRDGVILPTLLENIYVPVEYDFTERELLNMKISEESSQKRQQAFNEREVLTSKVMYDGDLRALNDELSLLWNDELTSFIAKYPEYEKLLK